MGSKSKRQRGFGRRARLLVTLASPFAGLLIVELGLRALLFGPLDIGTRFRDPGRYADSVSDDDYWKLRAIFSGGRAAETPGSFDPVIGWLNKEIESGSYRHDDEELVGDRRPVLLYGASFARGGRRKQFRFESILEQTDLSSDYRMLNYGIGGQGPDQAYLLIRRTLQRFPAESRPVVIIGLVVEGDFDRCILSYRDFPKPRLRFVNGRLRRVADVLPTQEHLATYPVSIRSYAWHHLLYGTRVLPKDLTDRLTGRARKLDERRQLVREIILETKKTLERAEVEYFFLLFHTERFLAGEPFVSAQERFITRVLRTNGVPYVCTRDAMLAFAQAHSMELPAFYRDADGHLNPTGNLAAVDAICQGLRGQYTDAPVGEAGH